MTTESEPLRFERTPMCRSALFGEVPVLVRYLVIGASSERPQQ